MEVKTERGSDEERTIHSGHFMVSRVHDDVNNEDDGEEVGSPFSEHSKGFDFMNATKETMTTYNFGDRNNIDDSLTKLFECMSLAYRYVAVSVIQDAGWEWELLWFLVLCYIMCMIVIDIICSCNGFVLHNTHFTLKIVTYTLILTLLVLLMLQSGLLTYTYTMVHFSLFLNLKINISIT